MPTITIELDDLTSESGEKERHELPGRFEVCPRCEGEGRHVHEAIDGNGITSSEFAEWDADDRETYLAGGYDVTCSVCRGLRVVAIVDEALLTEAQRAVYERHLADEQDAARERAADRFTRWQESGGVS